MGWLKQEKILEDSKDISQDEIFKAIWIVNETYTTKQTKKKLSKQESIFEPEL